MTLCGKGGRLHHLVVVPEFWKAMLGDDWLNNVAVHLRFGRYVEKELEREIVEHASRLEAQAKERGLAYSCELKLGRAAECVSEAAQANTYDLIVIGSPRPKTMSGYRSRLAIETLVKQVKTPLLVVPHPNR